MFSRVLFPALLMEGAGKQNVVVIVMLRSARLVVVAGLGLLGSLYDYADD